MKRFSPFLLAALAAALAAGPAPAQVMFALATNASGSQVVFQFDPARPGTITAGPSPVTGFVTSNESMVGLDTSPISGRIVGIGVNPNGAGFAYFVSPTAALAVKR